MTGGWVWDVIDDRRMGFGIPGMQLNKGISWGLFGLRIGRWWNIPHPLEQSLQVGSIQHKIKHKYLWPDEGHCQQSSQGSLLGLLGLWTYTASSAHTSAVWWGLTPTSSLGGTSGVDYVQTKEVSSLELGQLTFRLPGEDHHVHCQVLWCCQQQLLMLWQGFLHKHLLDM